MFTFNKEKKLILKSILTFLIFWYSSFFQLIPTYLFNLNLQNLTGREKVLLSTFSSCIVCFIFFFLYRKELKEEFILFKKNLLNNFNVGVFSWLVGLLVMVFSNLILNLVFHVSGAKNEDLVQEMIKAFPSLMVLTAGVLGPFNEEIAFRKALKDIFGNSKWLFILLSFLLFGSAHVIDTASQATDYLFILPYGALGASFAYAYYKTDTIFTSLFMHMIHNISLVILSIFFL